MAEFALGLTKMAVEGTVSRVKLAIEEEGKLRVRVENDLVFITAEFQMMQSLLKMANVKGAKNEVVRTWLRQVRDLAFDVEDCIEFVVHLDKKSAWGWLRRLGRMVLSCKAPPLPLDKAVDDIRRLKARVEDVSQRNTRYNLIGGDDTGSDSNSKAVSMQATPSSAAAAAFCTLKEVWEVTGKWRSMGDLQKFVMDGEGSDLQVISIWASTSTEADFGTASLFSKMYNDPAISGKFRTRARVKLMHPFNPDEFLKCLLTQFHACSHQMDIDIGFWRRMEAALTEEDGLTKAKLMQEFMSKQKYLIVLEEVFSVIEWNVVRMYLPDSGNGSRIVVSTRQLEVALLCTGKPYQVSELKHLSDDQSLCAFSKKYGRRSGKGELIWQIRCRGLISVFGDDDIKITLVNKVYTKIVHKWKQLEGVEFERHSWVDAPVPFNLEVFSRRLLLNLYSEDHVSKEIAAVSAMGDPCLTQECCKFLHEHDCLVVINGLQSTNDWDSIKAAFLSEPTKGCILVITNEANIAAHCVQEEGAVLNMEDMKADVMLRPLLKGSEQCERGGTEPDDRGRPFSIRRELAREWLRQLRHARAYYPEMSELQKRLLIHPGVFSLWGAGAGKSAFVRYNYYYNMVGSEASWESGYEKQQINLHGRAQKFSWVDVPHPFNLTEFSCRLLLDFHSDDHRSKKSAALSIMEGGQDPIEECCKFLCEYQCLVVIDGIQSTHEWDIIKLTFLSKPMKGSIVVITDEATVATYCVNHEEYRVIEVIKSKDLDRAPPPVKDFPSRLLSNRKEVARDWTNKYRLLGYHQNTSVLQLIQSLSRSGPSLTSVWGIAGIGKSIVVRSVYCHLMLGVGQWLKRDRNHFSVGRPDFTMYSWAEVPHPFNLTYLSWRLLQDFYSDDLDAKSTAAISIMEGQDPIQECRRFLREHRCLVVIDGLRSKDDWELIKAAFLPDSTKACIVLITNESTVARHCVDNKKRKLVNVKGLEADMALDLFNELNRGHKEFSDNAMELAKLINSKCGGIPRVIVTVAEIIAECGKLESLNKTKFMEILYDDFMGTLETDTRLHLFIEKIELHRIRGLLSWMQSYFDACSDSLKPCIFYLSIFPAGHSIRRRRLLRRWIAECYSRDTSRDTVEENGEKLISELVDLSIIQHKTSKVLCQVNGFFYEYIISRPLEDNLVFALEGNCSLNSERVGQHLTIRSSWDRDVTVFKSMDLSRLRSLTVFGKWMSFFISTDMRLLRVLDLEDTSGITIDDLEQIGKVLPRLKFLSVRGCKEISQLPESLCGLSQLQTLDVRNTSIVMLPPAIIKLNKLQYVRAGTAISSSDEHDETVASLPAANVDRTSTPVEDGDGTATKLPAQTGDVQTSTTSASCMPRSSVSSWLSKFYRTRQLGNGGVKVPAAIGKLTVLHTLGVVDVNVANGKAILKELKKLTQLRKLGVYGVSQKNWHDLCSVISGHAHLKSLSVQVNKDKEGVYAHLDDITQAPKTLNSLKLYGPVQILPSWIMHHENLEKGNLEMTVGTQEDLDIIKELRCGDIIQRICLKPIEDGELRVGCTPGWRAKVYRFPVLEINCTCRLHITCGERVHMYVELLIVRCSSVSSLRVSGLVNLQGLKEVWLKGSYGDELKEDLQRQIDETPEYREKPVLKFEEAQPHSS